MARTLAFPTKRADLLKVSPKNIIVNVAENGRAFPYSKGDVIDLLVDLRSGRGILQPVTVKPFKTSDGGAGLKLVAGYRRFYAATQYALENPDYLLPCIIEEPKDDLETLEINVRENVARKDLSPIDLGRIVQRFLEAKRTKEQVAEILACSVANVTQHLKLVEELTEREQALVHKRTLTADDAFSLLKVPATEREKVIETILEAEGKKLATEPVAVNGESGPARRVKVSSKGAEIRKAAREAGASVALRMPEFKKYLKEAIEVDGPGSNKGEVALKGAILEFLAGEITEKQMDNRFNQFCKVKG